MTMLNCFLTKLSFKQSDQFFLGSLSRTSHTNICFHFINTYYSRLVFSDTLVKFFYLYLKYVITYRKKKQQHSLLLMSSLNFYPACSETQTLYLFTTNLLKQYMELLQPFLVFMQTIIFNEQLYFFIFIMKLFSFIILSSQVMLVLFYVLRFISLLYAPDECKVYKKILTLN